MIRISQKSEAHPGPQLTTVIPIRIRRAGGRKWVLPATDTNSTPNAPKFEMPILMALSRAYHWQRLLDDGQVPSAREIARQEELHPTTVSELLRLTLLAPAVVRLLLAGRQPRTLSLAWLKNNELPRSWEEQVRLFDQFEHGKTEVGE